MTVLALVPLVVALAAIGLVLSMGPLVLKPAAPFEMEGTFCDAHYAGGLVDVSEAHSYWGYEVAITKEEFDCLEETYPKPVDRRYWGDYESPDVVHYTRFSTGNWCSPLPEGGTQVKVESPTGYTKDVTITNLETGAVYKSYGTCSRDVYPYHYRVTLKETGDVIASGVGYGPDWLSVSRELNLGEYAADDAYVLQMWEDGEEAPPPLSR